MRHLKDRHWGMDCWIIGKGPSLEHLKAEDIGPGVVIALYEAIYKVRELDLPNMVYLMQKDRLGWGLEPEEKAKAQWIRPEGDETLLVHKYESAAEGCYPAWRPRFVFENTQMGIPDGYFSMLSAIELARWFGCQKAFLVSFDSITTGDIRTYVPGQEAMAENNEYKEQAVRFWQYIQDRPFDHQFFTPRI